MRILKLEIDAKLRADFKLRTHSPQNGHLFVRFKTKTQVLTKDGYVFAKPGDFIFYNQNEIIEYNSVDILFNHDYFRFYLDEEEKDFFNIPTSTLFTFPLSKRLETILNLITSSYYCTSDFRDESLGLLGKLFLISAHEYVKQDSAHAKPKQYSLLLKLRAEILNAPHINWKIDELAAKVLMSPSYFQKTYKKSFGISCINDLINARIDKAKYLLSSTNKTEAEIAELCGYNNVEHFVRQFKKVAGTTPSNYKKSNYIL